MTTCKSITMRGYFKLEFTIINKQFTLTVVVIIKPLGNNDICHYGFYFVFIVLMHSLIQDHSIQSVFYIDICKIGKY